MAKIFNSMKKLERSSWTAQCGFRLNMPSPDSAASFLLIFAKHVLFGLSTMLSEVHFKIYVRLLHAFM